MNGRLYRLTPAGGKPNHYTDSYASALVKLLGPDVEATADASWSDNDRTRFELHSLRVDQSMSVSGITVERIA